MTASPSPRRLSPRKWSSMWISTKSHGSAKLFIACTFLLLGSSLGLTAGKGPFLAPESMTGGEPSKLHDVLDAKDSLEVPPIGHANGIVLSDRRSRLKCGNAR
jgi:hypothetical protein